jgi:hypothetical protein
MLPKRSDNKSLAAEQAYRQALTRAKTVAGALKIKKKRKRINQEEKALREENFETWFEINRRKRVIARPMSKVNKAGVALRKCRRTVDALTSSLDDDNDNAVKEISLPVETLKTISVRLVGLEKALEDVRQGIGPMAMEMKQCSLKQQDIEERLVRVSTRGHDLNRALTKACQEIFNSDQVWLYANEDFSNEILPTSMYHLRTWMVNKRASKQREASESSSHSSRGIASGNAPTSKPMGKSQTNAKRSANRERQDMGDSMVDHVPVCVADPTSYAGLAGVVSDNEVIMIPHDNVQDM